MSNLSDKEIDRLSREAADFYEPDHSSLSWTRLEQKLIEQIPERPPDVFRLGRINPYLWGSAVVLIAGVSFFVIKNIYYNQYSTPTIHPLVLNVPSLNANSNKANNNKFHSDSSSSARYADGSSSKNSELAKNSNKVARSAVNTGISGSSNSDLNTQTSLSMKIRKKNSNTAISESYPGKKRSGSKSGNLSLLASSGIYASHKSNTGNVINSGTTINTNENQSSHNNASEISDATNTNYQRTDNRVSLPDVITSGVTVGKVTGNDSLLNQITNSKIPVPYKSLRVNRSLNFGFAFGPDYTDAGGITNDQLGNNIGMTVGYYLTNKLSVNSGILYTNKFYWAPGRESVRTSYTRGPYSVGSNMTTAAAPPPIDYINGSSSIWELPLTLRYDLSKNEKNKFFVNAGFSSYFIMKQTYVYFFHSGQRLLAYKIEDDNQINYWFKVVNVSLGYESDMGKGFSFQAEPFLKLPFENMGIDNLKLNSYGFLLSFRYTPVLSRTKK
jgi:hypothetical protein